MSSYSSITLQIKYLMELQDKGNTPTLGIGPELPLDSNRNDWWKKATDAYMSALQGDGPYCLLDMDKGKKAFEESTSATVYGIAEAAWQNVWITKKRIPSPMISMKTDDELYFTPSIEDIRVGDKVEVQWESGWKEGIVNSQFSIPSEKISDDFPLLKIVAPVWQCLEESNLR